MENTSKLPRRVFVRAALSAYFGVMLQACGAPPPINPLPPSEPSPIPPENSFNLADITEQIAIGAALKTLVDKQMLKSTHPGVDLTYTDNETVDYIRAIPDSQARILAAIGYLDVEHSRRYNYEAFHVYMCNGYALDLLRLLLRNNAIGSRYNRNTGEPYVVGAKDINWNDDEAINAKNRQYPFLTSNTLDWWMQTHGIKYGWRQVTTQEELQATLKNGAVGLAVSKQEYVNAMQKKVEEEREQVKANGGNPDSVQDFYGHALVVFNVTDKNDNVMFGTSQATNNHQLELHTTNSPNPKVQPEVRPDAPQYSFWVYDLPPP